MSRVVRQLRWVLSSPRLSGALSKQSTNIQMPSGQEVVVHRVRTGRSRRGRFSFPQLLIAGVALSALDSVLLQVVFTTADDTGHDNWNDARRGHEDEDLQPPFFPFPFTSKRLDPQPYKGSGPEWREFVRIANDKPLQKAIKQNLATMVLQMAKATPGLTYRCGKDFKIRRYWMDVDYPYFAPPEYEVSGIRITEDSIEWASRPMEPFAVKFLQRVLWPTAIVQSFWTLGAVIAKQRAREVARLFGVELNTKGPELDGYVPLPTTHSPAIQKAIDRMRRNATNSPDQVGKSGSVALNDPATPREKSPRRTGNLPTNPKNQQPTNGNLWVKGGASRADGSPPTAWELFMAKYFQRWKPIELEPPRGSIAFSGLVELETERCWLVIDVFAWYNPKTKDFDPDSQMIRMRRVQDKYQRPLVR